jgi:hypothetical protein
MEPAAAAPAPSAAPVAPAPAATPEVAPVVETPKPERNFSQAELDEIIRKKDAKRLKERDELRRENEVLRKLALERAEREDAARAPKPEAAPADGEPKREQFDSYEAFLEARSDWRADQRVEKRFKEREESERQRSSQEKEKQGREQFQKMLKESAKGIEDFEDALGELKEDHPAAAIWSPALEAVDAPGRILHYLIKNPSEAERIASLPPGKQARALIDLERDQAAKVVKPSKAAEPIKPVNGGKTAADGDEMPDPAKDPKGWLAWRNRNLAAKRSGGAAR